ncbi:hypothetical protein B6U81_01055 [Thermoplasmatales archaeon ex4484_30]|nr:MAG: hypothetical protein B6U81_01055 [Thermoplasmatales archaeon ex4484_30]
MISENVLKEIKRRRIEESKLYDNYIKYSKEGEFVKASDERYAYSADAIHSNFYHAWMSKEDFMEKVREVEELRKWLIELLEQEISRLSQNKY